MASVETVLHLEIPFSIPFISIKCFAIRLLTSHTPCIQSQKNNMSSTESTELLVSVVRSKRHKRITVRVASNFVDLSNFCP